MFAHDPNAIRLAKRISIGLIVLSVLLSLFVPRQWIPHIDGISSGPEALLLFAIPMAALLLAYEITRAISTSLTKRKDAKARDAEFLRRFTRSSRSDRQNTDS